MAIKVNNTIILEYNIPINIKFVIFYGFCDEISNEKQADEKQLLEAEKNNLLQMKNDLFMQKSLRQEMLEFIMLANQQSKHELEEHTKCSYFYVLKQKFEKKEANNNGNIK